MGKRKHPMTGTRLARTDTGARTRRRVYRIGALSTLAATTLLGGCTPNMALLDPAGPIGAHEKTVLLTAFGLMLLVVVPVFVMTAVFAWRYRASNKKAAYRPKWDFAWKIDAVVWLVPAIIVTALGVLSWKTTHELSPYRALAGSKKPIQVEAIAMDWKWLFIYPKRHIATVNQLVFPANRDISFKLTSATVMTSFFIPRLGTQIYAMAGMRTKLHLLADKTGTFVGRNFQLSGRGYSDMRFKAVATTPAKFHHWVQKVRQSGQALTLGKLKTLEKPSIPKSVIHYASVKPHLFQRVIDQFRTAQTARTKSNT